MNIHESAEDYLEAILRLKEAKGYARSVDISLLLGVTKPSVSVAMKRLRENGYLTMDADNLITLTPAGMEIARSIYDRHKTLSSFLESLGVDSDVAREDACKIEHDISEESFTAIRKLTTLSAKKNGENREVAILVATSGDTGKAALEGFKDVPGTSCTVFYPTDGVSDVQKLQMTTTGGENTHVIALNGNFDDAQSGVKVLFSSEDFHQQVNARGKVLSSANSINFGRLVPQIVYYFSAYADLLSAGAIALGDEVNFVVPTGNFGNILAGYYARSMGLPVKKLICASNRNNVLTDFFLGGVYDTRRQFFKTTSPSMDILISSNLERLLFECADRDGALIARWMQQLRTSQSYAVGQQRQEWLLSVFAAGYADDRDCAEEIARVFEQHHYLMDTHTAVASRVLRQYRETSGDLTPTVIVSTASPYKFAADVLTAVAGKNAVAGLDAFACSDELEARSGMPVPQQVKALRSLPIRHTAHCEKSGMAQAVLDAFGGK